MSCKHSEIFLGMGSANKKREDYVYIKGQHQSTLQKIKHSL